VTCPTVRIDPVIVAQPAARAAALLDEFILGVGSGEALNHHVTGARWPSIAIRLEMLEVAVGVIRQRWSGEFETHHGRHYSRARPHLLLDAGRPCAEDLLQRFRAEGGGASGPDRRRRYDDVSRIGI
jgi:alkanesulfonate monooxygenase SsuD/methylene tetrahydromethanopterin reductase-like flavin-dependent oxidoreductase (luciferase family)